MEIGWYLRFGKRDAFVFLLRPDQLDEARDVCFIETDWRVAAVELLDESPGEPSEEGRRVRFVKK